jgi:alpha-L-rhamnosidase
MTAMRSNLEAFGADLAFQARRLTTSGLRSLVTATLFAVVGVADAEVLPRALRVENLAAPFGIEVDQPRFEWQLASSQRGQSQSAYQLQVVTTDSGFDSGKQALWDTGKVESSATSAVLYGGTPLESHQRCLWRVRAWDRDGVASSWSDPATFSMGMLKPDEWRAQWIGPRDRQPQPSEQGALLLPPTTRLRGDFEVAEPVRRATLYVTALGIVDPYLNGERVTDDWFSPGWTDYRKRVHRRAYDVTDRLSAGSNALGAELAEGWFCGYVAWGKQRDHYGKLPRAAMQLVIEHEDGSVQTVVSGTEWRAAPGASSEADFLMGQTHDARLDEDWSSAGFDDSGWGEVAVGAEVSPVIQAHPGPPVVTVQEFKPRSLSEPKPGVFVFDLGQNFAGVARLQVEAPRGTVVKLRFAERLNPDGTIYTTNLRDARVTDTYTCRGGGVESWTPRFTFHGFQYVEVTGLPEKPTTDTVVGVALSSDTPRAGTFECSDAAINQLASNIWWTQRANFIDIPTDCPQRDERLGWTGDAVVYTRAAALNADVEAFYRKWLVDLRDAQRKDGQFPCVAPVIEGQSDGGPAWADAGTICPWAIYEAYGDREAIELAYPSMVKFVEFCRARSVGGMLPPKEYHAFGDWLQIDAETPKDVLYTAYYAHSARIVSRAAAVLGKEADAASYGRLYEDIKRAFNETYVSDDGRVKGETQCAYVLAIANDLLEGDRLAQASQRLVADIESRGGRLTTGFIGTRDLMMVLSKIGRDDVAYRLLLTDRFPSWKFSIKHGATSIWERWDGWTPEKGFQDPGMNSFAHYSFGAVYQWMIEHAAGIRREEPGYGRVTIAPTPGEGLDWVKASYDSKRGTIRSEWRRDGDAMVYRVGVPANVTATVMLPSEEGATLLESDKPAAGAGHKPRSEDGPNRVRIDIGSGDYEFRVVRKPG